MRADESSGLFRFLLRSAGHASVIVGLLGVCASAFNAGVIAVVHHALTGQGERATLGLAFLGLGLGKVLAAYVSGRVANAYSLEHVTELRRDVIGKLLRVPYRQFERVGSARAFSTLTNDVYALHTALELTANAAVNVAVLVGGAAYLCYLSVKAFLLMLGLSVVAFAVYRVMSLRTRAILARARAEHDRLFEHFGDLTSGMAELKQHGARRKALLDGPLLETTERMLELGLHADARYLFAQGVNSLLVLVAIGFMLFLLPLDASGAGKIASGFVLTGLYLVGPLTTLLRLLPAYTRAEIALRSIERLGLQLGDAGSENAAPPDARPSFSGIELRDVSLRYDGTRAFELGPLNLSLQPGELLFLTGGNGSGKSTLAKLLVGLYEPDAGQVRWDGREVGRDERDGYRQLFSVVLSDFHVFDRLYGLDGPGLDARARAWLERLGLEQVVSVEHGALSSRDVSRGQKKRLALLTALLEDRPIYVLDEWAADQDPEFKQRFYRVLLPELKRRGKTLVVISHDDRYYDAADRIVTLRDGRIA